MEDTLEEAAKKLRMSRARVQLLRARKLEDFELNSLIATCAKAGVPVPKYRKAKLKTEKESTGKYKVNFALLDGAIITNVELIEALIESKSKHDKVNLAREARFIIGQNHATDRGQTLAGDLKFEVNRRLTNWLFDVLEQVSTGTSPNKAFGYSAKGRASHSVIKRASERFLIRDLKEQGAELNEAIRILAGYDLEKRKPIVIRNDAPRHVAEKHKELLNGRIKRLRAHHVEPPQRRNVPTLKVLPWELTIKDAL